MDRTAWIPPYCGNRDPKMVGWLLDMAISSLAVDNITTMMTIIWSLIGGYPIQNWNCWTSKTDLGFKQSNTQSHILANGDNDHNYFLDKLSCQFEVRPRNKKTSAIMSGWICKSSLFTIVAENIVWILHKKVPGSLDKASRNWCFFLRHVSCFPVIGGRPGPVAFCYLLRIKPALSENPTWYCSTSMHVNVFSYAFFRCTCNAQACVQKRSSNIFLIDMCRWRSPLKITSNVTHW